MKPVVSAPMICKDSIVSAASVIVNSKPALSDVMRLLEGIAREAYSVGVESVMSRLGVVPDVPDLEGGEA